MDELTGIILFAAGAIPAIILFVFFFLNKKARFAVKQRLRKNDPIINFIHPTSNRLKLLIGKFNPENEKEIILASKKNDVGYPQKLSIEVNHKPILDEHGTPNYWAVWGDNKTMEMDIDAKRVSVSDVQGNKITFLRIFELVYAWLSLGKKPQDTLTKFLIVLVIVAIGVLALNGFLTWQMLSKLNPPAALLFLG